VAQKHIIIPAGMSASSAPLSPATRFGNIVLVSGMVANDPATGKIVEGGIEAQARQTLENLKTVLAAAGCGLDTVLKTTCFLQDINDRPAFNTVYAKYFPESRPARSCFQVGSLGSGVLIEIEAIAGLPD
jgi:2-iminobutanoate/2-iminopropanoate deaminase